MLSVFKSGKVQRCAKHFSPAGGDNRVLFRVNGNAFLVLFAVRNVVPFSPARSDITAVVLAARGSVVTGRNDFVVFNNNRSVLPSETGGTLGNFRGYGQVIVPFTDSLHDASPINLSYAAIIH